MEAPPVTPLLLALLIWAIVSFAIGFLWCATILIHDAWLRYRRRRTVSITITANTSGLVRDLERVEDHLRVIGGHRGPEAPMGQVKL
jgi:hypothetical protein